MARTSPDRYLARVLSRTGRKPVGVAFAAGDRHVVTCAHVINTALGVDERSTDDPSGAWVEVEFPFAADSGSRVTRMAAVVRWMPRGGLPFDETDVAGLELEADLPPGVEPATLAADDGPCGERRVGAWGPNRDGGAARTGNVAGTLAGAYDAARLQVDVDLRGSFRVQHGYSGGPVWDQGTGQVVGIVQAVPTSSRADDVYVVSAATLVRAWPEVLYRPPPNPYRGLSAFTEADAPFFFGRDDFVTELADAVEEHPLILVAGRSGVGKSSAVAAGLVPRLRERDSWAVGSCRPGDDPMTRLIGAVAEAAGTRLPYPIQVLQAWHDRLAEGGLAGVARQVGVATGTARTLLIIDQFEQVFTECGPDERAALFGVLNRLVAERPRAVRVAVSMRADFHWLLTEAPAPLGPYAKTHWHQLRPMTADELHLAVVGPARVAGGVAFDDGLAEQICEEFEGRPAELPLLEFTLTRLWELQRGRRLTLRSYRELGGVGSTLARYAEERFAALTSAQQEATRRIFTELLQPDDHELARQIRRIDLRPDDWPTVELLRDARLLAVTTAAGGDQIVEVAHEALLRGWRRLADWAALSRDFRVWKAGVIADRQRWESNDREDDQLLRGSALATAVEMVAGHAADSAGVAEYVALSRRNADRERAERGNLLFRVAAPRLARESESALRTDVHAALALGVCSLQSAPTAEGERAVRRALALAATIRTRLPHEGAVRSAAFSPDGRRVATAGLDHTARVHDAVSGEVLTWLDVNGPLQAIVFGPDGTTVATADADGSGRVWRVPSGAELAWLEHKGPVYGVAFSPDGHRFVTAADDGSAQVLGGGVLRLDHGGGPVWSVAFSPDGGTVATAGEDGTARLWDAWSAEELARLDHGGRVWSLAFSPDGTRLATAAETGSVWVWTTGSDAEPTRLDHGGPVYSVTFDPGGGRVATACADGVARVWDPSTGSELARMDHGDWVWRAAFSPDGGRVVSAAVNGSARVWDARTGREQARVDHGGWVWSAAFSPCGDRVVSASEDGAAWVWDARAGAELARVDHDGGARLVAFAPDGDRVASAGDDGTVRVWDAATGAELVRLPHAGEVNCVVFGPARLATASGDGTARVWDADIEVLRLPHDGPVNWVAFAPDGAGLATASSDGTARIWDAGTEVLRLTHDGAVNWVAFAPDGARLATASGDGTARVWEAGTEILRLAHDGVVWTVVFSPDGDLLASASGDGTARLWDARSGAERARLVHDVLVRSVVFSPDGDLLASVDDAGCVRVWDADSAAEVSRLVHDGEVNWAAFAPDGSRLATACRDGSVRIWDPASGEELAELPHDDAVWSVAFSPDGSRLASASGDGSARVWALGSEELIAQALGRLAKNLTEGEWQHHLGPDVPYRRLREDLP
ncbi:nSTAND1 domain-containing NTPase [Herbidospora daliensis]|uniref:nSTAND1 domain-containing NTPase n=1 Tax=Herbidospora daliensis TaxID=295585 RepID=UPI000781EBF5|nr:trypsin-like peptidase domain-containing protein [Herbidospora daliensis]